MVTVIHAADVVDEVEDRAALTEARAYVHSRFYPPLPAEYARLGLAAARLQHDEDAVLGLPDGLNPLPRQAYDVGDIVAVEPVQLLINLHLEHLIDEEV